MRHHPQQRGLFYCKKRIAVCGAGRRSGKTERAKRRGWVAAMANTKYADYRVAFMAPTRDQAREIYWEDTKLAIPDKLVRKISETRLEIQLWNGAKIQVIGMDKPARVEGSPLDWAFFDEAGDQKPDAWERHVAPALETPGRLGRAWIYGVTRPGGRFRERMDEALDPKVEDMAWFTWKSADILSATQIRRARARMDPRTFAQEFEAEFVAFEDAVYYTFERALHASRKLQYAPQSDLIFTFDFGTRPGTANVLQEQQASWYANQWQLPQLSESFTACIDEVNIARNSRTPKVVRALLERYHLHRGRVLCFGDYYGGSAHSSQTTGSDWSLIEQMLERVFPGRVFCYRGKDDSGNPSQVARTNATCSRLKSELGQVSYLIDPDCRETILDMEEVCWEEGVRQIAKDPTVPRTHHSDGIDYYMERIHPVDGGDLWLDDPLAEYDLSGF